MCDNPRVKQGEAKRAVRFTCLAVLALSAGCIGTAEMEGMPSSFGDGGTHSDGGVDSGVPDAGALPDGGAIDAGASDAGGSDAGTTDAGPRDAGAIDAGPTDPCVGFSCSSGAHCVPSPTRCVCNPGYVADGGTCTPGDPGVPALRTKQQVCDRWTQGHVITAPQPFTKTTATCDQGVLSRGGLDDTLTRLNMHRWLVGLGPVSDDAADNDATQKCALMSAWNPAGPSAHSPPTTATCYTAGGAAGAGSSNIAWGSGSPAGAIDQWLVDNGNETTMGHRRWLLNPPLNPIGMGYYEGGNNYGSAACIRVFSGGGSGPNPPIYEFPPAGFVPAPMASWIWSVHGNALGNVTDAGVTRASDNMELKVNVAVMQGGYGQPAVTLDRQGWTPAVGETYRVHVERSGAAPIDYEVSPVDCP